MDKKSNLKKKIRKLTKTQIENISCDDIKKLSRIHIQCFSPEQCSYLTYEQLDSLSNEQLSFFTPPQRKIDKINIITKSIEETQKINLNCLSDNELKSLLKHQIECLKYEQIVNIMPYNYYNHQIYASTISNFRPKQYSFFTIKQLEWLTMYQSANIPRQYLSPIQIQHLPQPCFEYPKDTFHMVLTLDIINNLTSQDIQKLSHKYYLYMSKFIVQNIDPNIINNIPNHIFASYFKKTLLSEKQINMLSYDKIKLL